MRWPIHPVEKQRRFVTRFCPRKECPQHTLTAGQTFRFHWSGSFVRKDGRRVPRYLCLACRKTSSKQAFSLTYYLKRPELLVPIFAGLRLSRHRARRG